ncbi:MAG: pilus assembly protein TadG-related protein [Roseovarius sp.]|nr:pilus assembly protein TadG-related protein [Roseovarius sp.]
MLIKYNKRPGSDAAGHNEHNHLPTWATRFMREEDGTVTILALFIAFTFLIMGGIGLDAMRHEMERSSLQATLDSAVLAGASARTDMEARTIVENYFAKAMKAEYLSPEQEGDITTTLNSALITARAKVSLDTYLMKLNGVKTLSIAAAATAQVEIPRLEGILVLDVSGSMSKNSKMVNLKKAAKEFVTNTVGAGEPGSVVMSIVPFSFSVSPPESIYNALAVDDRHNYSTCLEFAENDYHHATLTSGSSSLSSGIPANQMIYTSVYGGFDDLDQSWRSCYNNEYMRVLPYSTSEVDLHAKIDSLVPDGNTSGNDGMNWGAALLDPTFRQVTSAMISSGDLDASLAHVPADYDDPDTLKVIIFMGDGANTTSYRFDVNPPKYRGKASDLYEVVFHDRVFKYAFNTKNIDRKEYGADGKARCAQKNWECVYDANGPKESVYFLYSATDNEYYSIGAAANGEPAWKTVAEFNNLSQTIPGYIETIQLDWEEAWGLMSPSYYSSIVGNSDAWDEYYTFENISGAQKNVLMQKVCGATKTEGTVVYTIGFEVPVGGTAERELVKCASSKSHYYRATGSSISSAFSSIAANVKNLRLIQ